MFLFSRHRPDPPPSVPIRSSQLHAADAISNGSIPTFSVSDWNFDGKSRSHSAETQNLVPRAE